MSENEQKKTTAKKPKGKAGRPRIEFDLKQIRGFGTIGATEQEIAGVLGCHLNTISDRMQNDADFCDAYKSGFENMRMSLRRAQLRKALDGNSTMMIWLGKQLLGQVDRADFRHTVDLSQYDLERVPAETKRAFVQEPDPARKVALLSDYRRDRAAGE